MNVDRIYPREQFTREDLLDTIREQEVRIDALTDERDAYILKQEIWENANDELRSANIRLRRALELMGEPACEYLHHDKQDRHPWGPCPVVARIRDLTLPYVNALPQKGTKDG